MKNIHTTFMIIVLFFSAFTYGQMQPIEVVLKNGDKLVGLGKLRAKTLKHKKYSSTKKEILNFSKIKSVEIYFSKKKREKYVFFPLKDSKRIIPVQEFVLGDKISLYETINNFTSGGVVGGIRMRQTIINYYVKRTNEKELTFLGRYNLFNNLKDKLKKIFKDCPLLIQKIDDKEFKMHSDIERMFEFYNTKCQ